MKKLSKLFFAMKVAFALIVFTGLANAEVITLAGFEAYPTSGAANTPEFGYLFNDNSSLPAYYYSHMTVTEGSTSQSTAIDLPLSIGTNVFSFTNLSYPVSDKDHAGISLFFTTSGSYNPTSSDSGNSAPNLSGFSSYPGSGVSTPAAGQSVPDYAGYPEVLDAYSGASSFTLNGYSVSISQLSFSGNGGTFDLLVTPVSVPEPSTVAFLVMGLSLGFCLYRRKLVA